MFFPTHAPETLLGNLALGRLLGVPMAISPVLAVDVEPYMPEKGAVLSGSVVEAPLGPLVILLQTQLE